MKADVKFWPDTKNLDLIITAESETEFALLGLLHSREKPKWAEKNDPEKKLTLIFGKTGRDKPRI